jgi:hypothetical protein
VSLAGPRLRRCVVQSVVERRQLRMHPAKQSNKRCSDVVGRKHWSVDCDNTDACFDSDRIESERKQ